MPRILAAGLLVLGPGRRLKPQGLIQGEFLLRHEEAGDQGTPDFLAPTRVIKQASELRVEAGDQATCDIYRHASGPPALACYFAPKGRSTLTSPYFTHVLLVPATVDIRDNYTSGSLNYGATADKVYVPNRNSTALYRVVLVRRVGLGTVFDYKEALLVRQSITWPSNDV